MKTKNNFLCICIMLLCLAATQNIMAQRPQAKPADHAPAQILNGQPATDYTYKVFQAPNKMFGYDIFLNGKVICHQPASNVQQGVSAAALAKKEHAEKAASTAIEKIRKGEPATLREDEIKKIISR